MKKYILLLSVLFVGMSVKSQTSYYPFPDSNAVWNFTYFPNQCPWGLGDETFSIQIIGDTIVGLQTYHKLYTPFVQFNPFSGCSPRHVAGYQGAIRQDILNRKVYFLAPSSTNEILLFDFNLQVGDTVLGLYKPINGGFETVQSIDSILVGLTYRKRWNINTCYNVYVVEGIGSLHGLIQKSPGCVTDQGQYFYPCHQQNQQTIFPNPTYNCDLITTVSNLHSKQKQIKIYPNPSSGIVYLDFNQEITTIELYDIIGNPIPLPKSHEPNKLVFQDLKYGTYILLLKTRNNDQLYRKIIICP